MEFNSSLDTNIAVYKERRSIPVEIDRHANKCKKLRFIISFLISVQW